MYIVTESRLYLAVFQLREYNMSTCVQRFCAAMVCVVVILARRSSKYCTNVRGAGLVANSEGMLALVPKTNSCGENPVASCTEVLYEKMQNLTQSSQSVFVQYIFRFYRSVSLYD
ncbi:uncharacterized protein LOC105663896 isoform X4 [Megachile rotundata]|uniref:uncharacterized protein LOC105663896 isoform X4 n=1 Tax=Megachile rotundata TaxID=143995 RepID=UPI003FD5F541